MKHNSKNSKLINSFKAKDKLTSDIFEINNDMFIMKNSIRNQLLKIADDFLEFVKLDFFIYDVTLTGSLANYNWSKYSDVDLHLIVDFSDIKNGSIEIIKEYLNTKKILWNIENNVKVLNYDVEIYIQDINEKHSSTGVYSILNNNWITAPIKSKNSINKDKILDKTEYFMDMIDKQAKSLNSIERIKNKIKKFRKSGLEKNGEYSYENLVFKMLRRNGYLKKINDIQQKLKNEKLSI